MEITPYGGKIMFVKEWPLLLFARFYPDYINFYAPYLDFTDPDYIVRVEYFPDGTINELEIGYATDEWKLKV